MRSSQTNITEQEASIIKKRPDEIIALLVKILDCYDTGCSKKTLGLFSLSKPGEEGKKRRDRFSNLIKELKDSNNSSDEMAFKVVEFYKKEVNAHSATITSNFVEQPRLLQIIQTNLYVLFSVTEYDKIQKEPNINIWEKVSLHGRAADVLIKRMDALSSKYKNGANSIPLMQIN